MIMTLFPDDILAALAANGRATRKAQDTFKPEPNHVPVVKIFNPYGGSTWLLTESIPDEPDILFGLCDLGVGEPELGYVSRSELETLRIEMGGCELPLERDEHFTPQYAISRYAEDAAR